MKRIASLSFGKDSVAMLLRLLEEEWPLDEVVFFDTELEFNCVYKIRDRVKKILEERNIRYTELKSEVPFLYLMLEKPVYDLRDGSLHHRGYGFCGGCCRWGTREKLNALRKVTKGAEVYVGLAYDEQKRVKRNHDPNKLYPLVDWRMTEADCLKFCRDRGYSWMEGDVDLYTVLDRVSCWCCANKNKKELYNIFRFLPCYWERLLELQRQIDRPMKNYKDSVHGEYGNLFVLEKVFLE